MIRSFLSACSVFVLILPTILFPVSAQACPVKLPETLLSLYRSSDAIYVGRYELAEDLQVIETTENRTSVSVGRHFDIASTLKGEPRKFFVLEERENRFKQDETAPEDQADNDDEFVPYRRPTITPGDTVILFLKEQFNGAGDKQLQLVDYSAAIKKMTPERLTAYESRIRELNSIFAEKKKPEDQQILDWLIRCSLDPLTRWEGAFDLVQSYQQMAWEDQQKLEEEKENADDGKTESVVSADGEESSAEGSEVQEITTENTESEASQSGDETETQAVGYRFAFNGMAIPGSYARLLTEGHKQSLMNAVLDSTTPTPGGDKQGSIGTGDRVLIELVSNWGDARLAKVLLGRLEQSNDAPLVSQLMTVTADILGDPEMVRIAEEYSESDYEDGEELVATEEDDEEEVSDDAEESPDDTETSDDEESTSAILVVSSDDVTSAESDRAADGAEPARRMTYAELRTALVAKFIARSVLALANAEARDLAKTMH